MRKFCKVVKTILLAFSMLINLFCFSQSRRFTHLTSEQGISQSEVYCFLKDSRGFVWFGTIDGLNRYDGYNVEVFNTKRDDPHTLSNNTIRSLVEDHLGRIWIGTNEGLNVYQPDTELFYQISTDAFQNDQHKVWSLLIYNGQLFIGSNKGLWRTNIQTNEVAKIESGFEQVKNIQNLDNIRSLITSKSGGVWVLSNTKISRIELRPESNESLIIEDFSFPVFSPAIAIAEDFTGNLWIAFEQDGILRYNPETKNYRHFNKYGTRYAPASGKCSSLALDKNGNLWIGTVDKGLNFVDRGELHKEEVLFETIQRNPLDSKGLNSNLIFSLYISEDNLLWVGTIGSGVNIFNPNQKKFTHYKFRDLTDDSPNSNFMRSVYADNQSRIWTGTHNNGLYLFDANKDSFQKLGFETQSIFHISSYKENKKFICTSKGVYLVKLINNDLQILSHYEGTATFYIERSKADVYWVATLTGLLRVNIDNDKIIAEKEYSDNTTPRISINNCRVLLYDDIENKLLVGTEGGGLNVVSLNDDHYPQKVEIYKNTKELNSISNNFVRSIVKDRLQNFWIGTFEGLNKIIRDESAGTISFQSFTMDDGLPNNMIQVLVEDNNNSLWIGTNGGLSQFILEEGRFINYTVSDGIQSNEFSEHCVYKKPNGEIIMGGINGINTFYPEQIEISSQKPQTTIIEFYLFNEKVKPLETIGKRTPLQKSVVLTDTIILLPNQNNIGFDFSSMIYPSAEKVQYAYMLEGFDADWHYTHANQRNANYTNLSHGSYIFKVKSTNNDGVWDEAPREVYIQIKTPFALTWVAIFLYGLIVVMIFLYFSYYTVIRYTTKKRLLMEKDHNQKIHELDVLRTKFFINISHDLRTPLTLISGPINTMLHNKSRSNEDKEKLQLIQRNVKRLNYLVEQLLDVRKAESGKLSANLKTEDIVSFTKDEASHFSYAVRQKGLALNIISNSNKISACFDRAMMSRIYFNIISNAIKFTERGKIEIIIEKVDKHSHKILNNAPFDSFVKVEVRDTGRGIPPNQREKIFDRFYQGPEQKGKGYGIGLSHTKELIDAHKGYIEVETTENEGTTIRFFLPEIQIPEETEKNRATSNEDIYFDAGPVSDNHKLRIKDTAKTLLIIEDNADMRNYIASELEDTYNIIQACDGMEGIEKADLEMPDIVVCDVMMPNMDGIEFCKRMKSNIQTSHIPIILLTAKVDRDTKFEGIETGADDYIPKPFDVDYLKIRIKNLLQSREILRKRFQNSLDFKPSSVTVTSLDEKFLKTLISELDAGIPDADFSISSLELKMGMSHANFYRKIKSLTGQSGQELLLSMRMKRAHQIMSENPGIRVAEIAYMVGFQNPNYFGKCFKKKFGLTPTEFLNQ